MVDETLDRQIRAALTTRRQLVKAQSRCRNLLHMALKKGKVVKQRCACGNPKSQAHHDDYNKPLDVIWLCRRHHTARHRELGWGYRGHRKAEISAHLNGGVVCVKKTGSQNKKRKAAIKKQLRFDSSDPEFHAKVGQMGGLAGTGIKKVRGDSDFYSRLSLKRKCLKRKRRKK